MKFLPPRHGRDVPEGGELGVLVLAVYKVVVEGMVRSASLARPQQRLVGVGPRKLGQRQAYVSER